MIGPLPGEWHGAVGEPLVVFGNSLGARQGSWREQLDRVGARVLTFDLPGHSAPEPEPFSFDEIVDATERLLDTSGVSSVLFCGVSLGGAIGVALAARRPDLIRCLVTVNAPIRQASPEFWYARADMVERQGLDALADDLPSRWFTSEADPARVAEVVAQFRAISPIGYAQNCRAIAEMDLSDEARRIAVPTIIVSGAADLAVPASQAEEYALLIPGAESRIVDGAAHLLPIERPDELASVLAGHLD